jgi:hypothetical protein
MWTMKLLLLALVFALATPCGLEARCVRDLALEFRVAKRMANTRVVFRGTVLDVRRVSGGQVVTIEADRVWLGRVPRNVTVYNATGGVDSKGAELTNSTAQRLTAGERYIIFTHEQSPEERQLFGIRDAGRTYGTQGCGIWVADQQDVRVLGTGHEVKTSTSSR